MRCLLFLCIILAFFSCSNPKPKEKMDSVGKQANPMENNVEDENQITCWGIAQIELGDDLSAIEEKVGKENVVLDSLMPEGTFDGFVTKIWKGTDKEIRVIWEEKQAPFKTMKYLEILGKNSPYHFANGIKIGTSLEELQKHNGNKPFKLYGFGWDNGGTIVDFSKGKIAGDIPCFKGVLSLTDTELAGKELTDILGDHIISSDHPSLKKYKAILSVIRVENTK